MKNIFISLILLLLTTYVLSQQKNDWRLDSTYSKGWDYNIGNWVIGECRWSWSDVSGGVIKYQYYMDNRLMQENIFGMDTLNLSMNECGQYIYEYYEDSIIWYLENSKKVWSKLNENGQEIEKITYSWWDNNGGIPQWVPTNSTLSSYNSIGKITEAIRSHNENYDNPSSPVWRFSQRNTYTYDESNRLSEEIEQGWDEERNYWLNEDKWELTYDSIGHLYEVICYYGDSTEWIDGSKIRYSYEFIGNTILDIPVNEFHYSGGPYLVQYKYDKNGNLLEEILFNWDEVTGERDNFRRQVYSYDTYGNIIERRLAYADGPAFDFIDITKEISFWSQFSVTGSPQISMKSIEIYPNPVYDLLYLNTNISGNLVIELYSVSGQLLHNTKVEGPSNQIDLSSFPKGVYIITVGSRDQVWTEKIIKL